MSSSAMGTDISSADYRDEGDAVRRRCRGLGTYRERGAGQAREGSTGSSGRHRSVMDDQDAFEHGADTDSIAKGMGSSGERASGSSRERNQGGGITNRSMERERSEQQQLPERGKSQSER